MVHNCLVFNETSLVPRLSYILYSKNHLLCPSVVIIMLSKITIMLQWNVIKLNKINPFDPEFFCFDISHTLSSVPFSVVFIVINYVLSQPPVTYVHVHTCVHVLFTCTGLVFGVFGGLITPAFTYMYIPGFS